MPSTISRFGHAVPNVPSARQPVKRLTYYISIARRFLRYNSTQVILGFPTASTPSLLTPAVRAHNMKPTNERKESWSSIYSIPPSVEYPYNPVDALTDIPGVSYVLDLFLASHMLESEDYCNKSDKNKWVSSFSSMFFAHLEISRERLYFAAGYGLIQAVKGLMSYEDVVRIFLDS